MSVGSTITNNGHKIIINRSYKAAPDYTVPSRVRVGANTSSPTISTTSIDRIVPIQGTEAVDSCDATTGWTAGAPDSAVALNTSTYKEGTGSLTISKINTGTTSFFISKTTTSRDFTSKDFWMWVYIVDITDLVSAGTAMVIKFGSDSSNYYYYNVPITSLTNGWNYVTFNTTTKSGTTGAPTIATCAYTQVLFNTDLTTDLVAANRIIIDDIKVASADDYYKGFEASYPIIDETLYQVTMRARLLTTDANGYLIDSIGWYNTDATNLLHSIDVIIPESKSSTDELIFESVDRRVI